MNEGLIAIMALVLGIFFFLKVVPFLFDKYGEEIRKLDIQIQIKHKKRTILFHRVFFAVVFSLLVYGTIHAGLSLTETGVYVRGGLNKAEALIGGMAMIIVSPFFLFVFAKIQSEELEELQLRAKGQM